jgi:hypothetical protein
MKQRNYLNAMFAGYLEWSGVEWSQIGHFIELFNLYLTSSFGTLQGQ